MDENRTRFVVGLGNPGRKYERTRHNVGFMVLAALARRWQPLPPRRAFQGELCDARVKGQRVMMLAPQTYMNLSGQAVVEMAGFYKALPEEILVVLDDMALPVGRLRARAGGSGGGQKGLGDIINRLGTSEVPRLRIGIGAPPGVMDAADFVLTAFLPEERPLIEIAVEQAADAGEDWVFHGITSVMDKYNRKAETDND